MFKKITLWKLPSFNQNCGFCMLNPKGFLIYCAKTFTLMLWQFHVIKPLEIQPFGKKANIDPDFNTQNPHCILKLGNWSLERFSDFLVKKKKKSDIRPFCRKPFNRPLSLGGHVENALFLHGKPRTEFASGRGLPCKNKAFDSPKTQHGRRVRRVYRTFSLWHYFTTTTRILLVFVFSC